LVVAFAAAMSASMLGGWMSSASASAPSSNVKPTLTATQATFTIPPSATGTFIMNLWTLPKPTMKVGHTEGASGTLTLPVPQTASCEFQVDVRVIRTGGHLSNFYSGLIATVPGCGQSGSGPRVTPGFWKTHLSATNALLPQDLGADVVTTAAEATAVFQAMKCSDAVDCLAGHLLAAELDVANGSSICISGTIFQAGLFLDSVGYNGPATYSITQAQRSEAIALETVLDSYTNNSTSTSC
jgi:hypothetical protein